jgi:hypothetical protein
MHCVIMGGNQNWKTPEGSISQPNQAINQLILEES